MRRWFAITTLTAFITIAVFGFLGMLHGDAHGGCIVMSSRATACPSDLAPFEEIAFHIAVWKGLSGAVAPSPLSILTLVVLAVFVLAARWRARSPTPQLPVCHAASIPQRPLPLLLTFLRWIALHERRDPAPARR